MKPAALPRSVLLGAGALYAAIIVAGLWSELGVRAAIVAPGDPAATAANILARTALFRAGFAADTVMIAADVALAVLLYRLFRPVAETLALLAAAFRLIQAAILGANLMDHDAALLALAAQGIEPAQREGLALLALETQSHGYDLGLVFFGLNCLLTGALIFRSGFLPRLLGLAVAGSGMVYLAGSAITFLAPSRAEAFAPAYLLPLVAETAFCVWLLAKGLAAPHPA